MTLTGRPVLKAGAASAALLLCAAAPAATHESTVSPDGKLRAVVECKPSEPATPPDEGAACTLWVEPAKGGAKRVIVKPEPGSLKGMATPTFSLDGGFVYVSTPAWVTSGAIHQVEVASGRHRFVVDGNSLRVIRTGAYRGMLLVGRHKYRSGPEGGSYDPVDLVRPDGKVVLTVPGSETDEGAKSVDRWLKEHGWAAS